MNRSLTKKPLRVSTDGTVWPYIVVPVSQLDDIKKLLDDHQVAYWVDEDAISLNGEPEVTWINFGNGVDPQRIQRLLDGIP